MKPFLASVAAFSSVAIGQCCPGARNVTAESQNGMVRIEAVSQHGTGYHHGPYHFQFRWSDKVAGSFVETSRFEVRYDSRDHFWLRLYVSPAGNGVLVEAGFSPDMVFHDRAGRVLRTWKRTELKIQGREDGDDGHFLGLLDPTPVPVPGYPNALNYCRRGELFLPAAEPVAEALEARLLACIAAPRDGDVAARIAELGHADKAIADRAAAELKRQRAVDALERAAAGDGAGATRAKDVLGAILVEQFGCPRPWRDVPFLGALLLYPSAKVAGAATERIEAVLGKDVLADLPRENLPRIARWLQTQDRLEWNAGEARYGWKAAGK